MSLESLYNSAAANTYVGTVRTKQAADVGAGRSIVNYMDGEARGREQQPDEFQKEFTRNATGAFKTGGAQGIARNAGTTLTRWTAKACELAFGGKGPASLISGFYNNRFTNNNTIHLYTPGNSNGFTNVNASAELRKNSSPSGAPSGL